MKLLPAMFFVIVLFLGGMAFRQSRTPTSGIPGLRDISGLLPKKLQRPLTVILLFLVLFFLLKIIGKLALLITGILFLLSFPLFKKR